MKFDSQFLHSKVKSIQMIKDPLAHEIKNVYSPEIKNES